MFCDPNLAKVDSSNESSKNKPVIARYLVAWYLNWLPCDSLI